MVSVVLMGSFSLGVDGGAACIGSRTSPRGGGSGGHRASADRAAAPGLRGAGVDQDVPRTLGAVSRRVPALGGRDVGAAAFVSVHGPSSCVRASAWARLAEVRSVVPEGGAAPGRVQRNTSGAPRREGAAGRAQGPARCVPRPTPSRSPHRARHRDEHHGVTRRRARKRALDSVVTVGAGVVLRRNPADAMSPAFTKSRSTAERNVSSKRSQALETSSVASSMTKRRQGTPKQRAIDRDRIGPTKSENTTRVHEKRALVEGPGRTGLRRRDARSRLYS